MDSKGELRSVECSGAWDRIQALPKLRDVEVIDHKRINAIFYSRRTIKANREALLAYTRGDVVTIPCRACAVGTGVFKSCVRVTTTEWVEFVGCCVNCRFGEQNRRCDFKTDKARLSTSASSFTPTGKEATNLTTLPLISFSKVKDTNSPSNIINEQPAQMEPNLVPLGSIKPTVLVSCPAMTVPQGEAPVGDMVYHELPDRSTDVYLPVLREVFHAHPLQNRRKHIHNISIFLPY